MQLTYIVSDTNFCKIFQSTTNVKKNSTEQRQLLNSINFKSNIGRNLKLHLLLKNKVDTDPSNLICHEYLALRSSIFQLKNRFNNRMQLTAFFFESPQKPFQITATTTTATTDKQNKNVGFLAERPEKQLQDFN